MYKMAQKMKYTPLYEKPWKKTKNALVETTHGTSQNMLKKQVQWAKKGAFQSIQKNINTHLYCCTNYFIRS